MSSLADQDGVRCTGCQAACCARYRVPLTALDLLRLVELTGAAPADVAAPYLARRAERYAGFRLDRSDDLVELALAKADGAPTGGPCRFLSVTPGGAGRCRAYEGRPLACRAFPATIEDGAVELFPDAVCPPDRVDADAARSGAGWREAVERMDLEAIVHESLAAEWNRAFIGQGRREATLDELLEFLLDRALAWRPLADRMGGHGAQRTAASDAHRGGKNPLLEW